MTLTRTLLSGSAAPRRFDLVPAEQPLAPARPELRKRRRFYLPPIRVRYAEENLCYSARRYFYARESRGSDVTVPAGQDVCAPASAFQVRDATP
jgi:hypothetical protein